jgi:hypothetical protein
VALQYSVDGVNFVTVPVTGSTNAASGLLANLSGISALQSLPAQARFRIYTFGAGAYTATGIGLGTAADDLIIRGSANPTGAAGLPPVVTPPVTPPVVTPPVVVPPAQTANDLARFEFTGLASAGIAVPATAAPVATGSNVQASPLSRGAGMIPAVDWVTLFHPGRFSSYASNYAWAANLQEAIEREQYYQFSLAPDQGRTMSLDSVRFQAWFSHPSQSSGVALQYSTDGVNFVTVNLTGTVNSATGMQANLASISALQSLSGQAWFRIYTFGAGAYTATGIGLGTAADDLVVRGTVNTI